MGRLSYRNANKLSPEEWQHLAVRLFFFGILGGAVLACFVFLFVVAIRG